ncbi:diguanylate cyclase [Thalassotalea sp. M1531]|uniref:Diguanylate cyclase n=1 Tax=Thalassotalea algicola TaxID=2716224 RepID=A0A7Y0LDF9_9GAMM|nr:two-component regulator propeller domain-containing protein [Thalassotalea algicola]NMP32411.1 diguanylate cyclase [Thalassotalea algicola]
MKKIIVLLVCLSYSYPLFANSFDIFKRFSIENPLSYKAIYAIAQDHDGFMWFGSQEGLHRYDGYDVVTYLHDNNVLTSLSSDVVSDILVDSKGRLWVATREGLNLFNPLINGFNHLSTAKLLSRNINTLMEDSNGNIWVGTEKGINVLSENEGSWNVVNHYLIDIPIHAFNQINDGNIWIGTNGNGIYTLDTNTQMLVAIAFDELSTDVNFAKLINAIHQDDLGNVWVGTAENGLVKIDTRVGKKVHFTDKKSGSLALASNTVEAIYQDSRQNIWIATDKGLSIYDFSNKSFTKAKHSNANMFSLAGNFVLSIYEDDSQMVWVGTMSGTSRWDPHMATFNQYDKNNELSLSSKLITGFTNFGENSTLISSYDGLVYQLDSKTNDMTVLLEPSEIGRVRISALMSEEQIIWIGTRSSGLIKYDLRAKRVIRHYKFNGNEQDSLSANSITDIYRDSNSRLWVSTYHNGLNLLLQDNSFKRFTYNEKKPTKGPSISHVLQVEEDKHGDIWLATYGGGLNRLDVDSEEFTHLNHNPDDIGTISSDLSWIMLFDQQGNLWSGSQAGGINFLSHQNIKRNNFIFEHFDIKDGMKDQTVYGLVQDISGNIWFSSNNGISRYSPTSKVFKHFDNRHGLTDLEFNHGAVFRTKNNILLFGSARGFNGINPSKIIDAQPAPIIKLNNIYKLNEPILFKQPLSSLNTVNFDYQDQLISFEYVGLNYSEPEATRYKYRLLGFEDEWIDAGKLRRATYTNLPAGSYTFEVTAANSDNVWSNHTYQLNIIVNPAPWNTWWAYLLYVFFLAFALLLYSRLMNRKLLSEQDQRAYLKEQVIEKTEKYVQKNSELEQANRQLEKVAIIDKVTGVKSRRYLDIYIEQASKLMLQIHNNLKPLQRSLLPRLYILMVQIQDINKTSNSQIINIVDLMEYSKNEDDLVVRWSENVFAIIGYEKGNDAADLSTNLTHRFKHAFDQDIDIKLAYSFFPFDLEQPFAYSWDQISVLIELSLKTIQHNKMVNWVGIHGPKQESFDFISVMELDSLELLSSYLYLKHQ